MILNHILHDKIESDCFLNTIIKSIKQKSQYENLKT